MELKLVLSPLLLIVNKRSNRTFMELKWRNPAA